MGLLVLALVALALAYLLLVRLWTWTTVTMGPNSQPKAPPPTPMACQLQRTTPVLVLQPGPDNEVGSCRILHCIPFALGNRTQLGQSYKWGKPLAAAAAS